MDASSRKTPFFVLGSQRSGTTMLRLMLNQHPHLCVPHETGFMTRFYREQHRYGDLSVPDNAARLLDAIARTPKIAKGGHILDREAILSRPIRAYPDLIDAIMDEYAKAQGKPRWGDKTPFYTLDIDILWTLFPGCKIIHLVRDGRDVLLSQRNISWCSNSVPRLAEDWRWKTTVCHKVGSVLGPAHFLELRYEDLVRDTEGALKAICRFLDEPFAPQMLHYHEHAPGAVPSDSLQWHRNSVKAPDPSKLYAWKRRLSPADRIIFEQNAGPALDLFGYERENHPSTLGSRLKNLYYALVVRW